MSVGHKLGLGSAGLGWALVFALAGCQEDIFLDLSSVDLSELRTLLISAIGEGEPSSLGFELDSTNSLALRIGMPEGVEEVFLLGYTCPSLSELGLSVTSDGLLKDTAAPLRWPDKIWRGQPAESSVFEGDAEPSSVLVTALDLVPADSCPLLVISPDVLSSTFATPLATAVDPQNLVLLLEDEGRSDIYELELGQLPRLLGTATAAKTSGSLIVRGGALWSYDSRFRFLRVGLDPFEQRVLPQLPAGPMPSQREECLPSWVSLVAPPDPTGVLYGIDHFGGVARFEYDPISGGEWHSLLAPRSDCSGSPPPALWLEANRLVWVDPFDLGKLNFLDFETTPPTESTESISAGVNIVSLTTLLDGTLVAGTIEGQMLRKDGAGWTSIFSIDGRLTQLLPHAGGIITAADGQLNRTLLYFYHPDLACRSALDEQPRIIHSLVNFGEGFGLTYRVQHTGLRTRGFQVMSLVSRGMCIP